jgi:predicted amidohydrolase YtcJ
MPTRTFFQFTAALLITSSVTLHAESLTIFTNGKIVMVDEAFTITDAMAVEGERIVALGDKAKALATEHEEVKRVDLGGRMVLPGLMDSHSHPVGAATMEFDHPVPDIEDIPQLLDYIASRAKALPEGSLIGIAQVFITRLKEQRYPTREELDRVAPKHPVQFSTGPDSMLNSLALKLAGIDRNFKVPAGSTGIVVFDEKGEPTGLMHAFSPKIDAKALSKKPDATQTRDLVKKLFSDYNSVGFTTIADRGASRGNIEVYQSLRDTHTLTVRLRLSHTFSTGSLWRTTEQAIDEIIKHPLTKPDPMLQIIGTKIWLDGGMLTGSALMQEPWGVSRIYGITDKDYRGVQRTPSEHLAKMVRKVASAGLQFTAHSVGDGAVKLLLDTYDEVNKDTSIRESRPCITHCNFMTPESIAHAARLGAVIDMQPIWFHLDGATLLKQFGNERMSRFQPLRALFDAKVAVGGGSDHMQKIGSLRSINPYNPWLGMWIAVSRECRYLDEPLHLEGGLTREEAIRLYTINNAKVLFLEKELGSLEVGKRADFIILDRDVLTCPLDDLKTTQVYGTWLDGKPIWAAEMSK